MWQIFVMLALLTIYTFAQYHEKLRQGPWLLWAALLFSVCSNILWVTVVKNIDSKAEIFRRGFYWDMSTYLPWVLVPLVFFSVRLSWMSTLGLGFVLMGAALFHWGGIESGN